MVVVPGSEGYFGVLPRHAPMISTLSAGVIDIYQGGAVVDRIFVAGGFAEVTEARCTVLEEGAVPPPEVEATATEQEIAQDRDELKYARHEVENGRRSERQRVWQ